MDTLTSILNVPVLQAAGVIALYALAIRVGIPIDSLFKSLFKINGNGSYQGQIDVLKEHAKNSNEEVGRIEKRLDGMDERLGNIEKGISFIEGQLSK